MLTTERPSDIRDLLRQHGMKATPQRLAIANLMLGAPMHATAQQIHERLNSAYPSLSPNTIYLTLASFAECGLLRRFHAAGTMIFDSNTSAHDHACCQCCGNIVDIPMQTGSQSPNELQQWKIHFETRTWSGICPSCSQQQNN